MFDAIQFVQNENIFFISKMKFDDLDTNSEIPFYDAKSSEGYQRPPVLSHVRNIAKFFIQEKVPILPSAIIAAINKGEYCFNNGKLEETNEIVKTDEILVDGKNAHDVSEVVVKDREMLSDNGIVIVSATVDHTTKKLVCGPEINNKGFLYMKENIDVLNEATKIARDVILENTKQNFVDFNKVKMGIRDKLGKYFYKETECKPMILVVISEI